MLRMPLLVLLVLALSACGGGGGGDDEGAIIVVTNLQDAGDGSLRAALASIEAGGTILFEEGLSGTITLTSGTLIIDRDVIIQGPGAADIAISGNDAVRVFDLGQNLEVEIGDLTIRNGLGAGGSSGGLRAPLTLLVLRRLVFADCNVTNFGRGGGLHIIGGVASVDDCLFERCAGYHGGGFTVDGGVANFTRCTMQDCMATGVGGGGLSSSGADVHCLNCTFSGNNAAAAGGFGVYSSSTAPSTGASLFFCTITLNSVTDKGGGVSLVDTDDDDGNPIGTLLTIKNTIVANNVAGGAGQDMNDEGSMLTLGYNVIGVGEDSGLFDDLNNDQVGSLATPLDAHLQALANNGGPTPTHMILASSPALDAVPVIESTNRLGQLVDNDQRGELRPAGVACDTGAVERD